MDLLQNAGYFIYPLGVCILLILIISIERILYLKNNRIFPKFLEHAVISGVFSGNQDSESIGQKIVQFCQKHKPSPQALNAYVQVEIVKLERGLYVLDIIATGAPLVGLIGTIAGLIQIFSSYGINIKNIEILVLMKGIGLALSTTMLGILIAIPALVASHYLYRKVDIYASQLELLKERLIEKLRG